jgi:hypothetical protein
MKHPRRTLRAALAVVAALAASACGDLATEPNSPVAMDPVGVYTLVSINAQALPYTTMSDGASSTRIASGQLVMDGARFQQVLGFSSASAQWQSPTTGTYAVEEGGRITFRVSTGSTFEGTLYLDGRLEYVVQGNYGPLVFTFRRG